VNDRTKSGLISFVFLGAMGLGFCLSWKWLWLWSLIPLFTAGGEPKKVAPGQVRVKESPDSARWRDAQELVRLCAAHDLPSAEVEEFLSARGLDPEFQRFSGLLCAHWEVRSLRRNGVRKEAPPVMRVVEAPAGREEAGEAPKKPGSLELSREEERQLKKLGLTPEDLAKYGFA
jgi:hypothetical protein